MGYDFSLPVCLKGGIVPLSTSAIESTFSQVCNRINRVGRRRSERGFLKCWGLIFARSLNLDYGTPNGSITEENIPKLGLDRLRPLGSGLNLSHNF